MTRSLLLFVLLGIGTSAIHAIVGGNALDDPFSPGYTTTVTYNSDTIPDIDERYDDFLNDNSVNPFDLDDPNSVEQEVEYDPETGQYIITETIGDDYYRPSTFMTFDEYLDYRQRQEERAYFDRLSGVTSGGDGTNNLDPIAQIDVKENLLERLFGGTEVDIRPQGNIDLTFGVDYTRVERPDLPERQRRQGGFDFDMNINMNVTGKIGEKLNLTTNYNTNATFNFDNQIKLDYNSDDFAGGEDAILQKIEAGNVSLPLRGTLIQGAQSLFGLKTELKFGHLRLTGIASQQKSQQENIQIEGGSQVQTFEVKADEYDENRHFFLTFFNRNNFERALINLPQINTLFKIKKLEVWITNDRNEVTDVRDIVALADLGEPTKIISPGVTPNPGWGRRDLIDNKPLPDNAANDLYNRIVGKGDDIRDIDRAVATLENEFGLRQSRDFEKVSARKLRESEYTFHPELGFISVNVNVQPDQVLGVAFEYEYNGNVYRVGEMSINNSTIGTDTTDLTPKVLFVKMLKSTTQRTDVETWDLMMKNIYSIGAFQVNQQDFRLDIFYDDPGAGQKRFITETEIARRPLLRVFNLDQLNTQGDPQPDGIFDYVPGVTINPRNGRIMFPKLEPFDEALGEQISDPILEDKYTFPELYDSTLFVAQEYAEQNRFIIRGEYKSSVSSEISLGAFNIPEGSVRVNAGGQQLIEGRDYEVDYSIGKVRILNDALLQSGVPINVSYEDNTLFGFQTKTMIGLRADYEVDENFNIGGTFLQLFERPFTQKVNVGDDPINNKMYGLDVNLSREAPWLTKAVDAIPGLSTTAPSNISLTAEAAAIQPGHARAINQNQRDRGGVVYIDDFEGSGSSFDLRTPANRWQLASTPRNDADNNNPLFPEADLVNDLRYGANRARLNWYRIDPVARTGSDGSNPYTAQIPQTEVFPNLNVTPNQLQNVQTFDLTYYPNERGPYNFDVPDGYPGYTRGISVSNNDSLILNDPATRWGGIMRELTTNDFQSANIEFLEFWVLSPFLDPNNPQNPAPDVDRKEGELYINLGNVSEDILRDSRLFFENGLPAPTNPNRRTDRTRWGDVPVSQQITRAFDNDPESRDAQDVGLDGLDNMQEQEVYSDYINTINAANPSVGAKVAIDPSNDDFRYYNAASFGNEDGLLQRYRDFNNPQGNSRSNNNNSQFRETGTNIPDAEDLNRDNTLNETENYFQYKIPLRADPTNPREIDLERTPYITDRLESTNGERIWYRFRVPLNTPDAQVGGIRDFRSIRFMRMYMHGFEAPVTLRFARLEFVRNQWRRYRRDFSDVSAGENGGPIDGEGIKSCDAIFTVDNVNIEENSSRMPFNYVLPEGIQREQAVGVFSALQNEQSQSMRLEGLCDGDDRMIFKIVNMDMRVYERFKMFVHAEEIEDEIDYGELSMFVRLGSDFQNNYYEYEIPLTMSDPDNLPVDASPSNTDYKREVWRPENEFDFRLKDLVELKKQRNNEGVSLGDEFVRPAPPGEDPLKIYEDHLIKIKGNPSVGQVKIVMVGVRNRNTGFTADRAYDVEVWLNEMRLTGLDERGGAAATARLDAQLADFGSFTAAGNISSIGFGAIDQKVQERNRETISGYDLAANINLDKFLPESWGIRLPVYAQYSKAARTPEFDPYDLDITLKDKLDDAENNEVRDSILQQAQEVTTIRSLNLTNVRKERTNNQKTPMPWDISNFSVSYSYTETEYRDPIIESNEEKNQTAALDYSYSRRGGYIEPFKGLNVEALRLIKEFNFNPLPNSFSFSSVMNRRFETTRYRFAGVDPRFNTFYNKRFTWDRDYDLQWDFTKSLKFSFNATNSAVIDEPDETLLIENFGFEEAKRIRQDSIWENVKNLGRPKNYQHNLNLSYTLPIKYLPFFGDWVTAKAQYQAGYSWTAAALNMDSLGNVIQNNQTRSGNVDLNMEKLYDKVPYLRKINRGNSGSASRRSPRRNPRSRSKPGEDEKEEEEEKKRDRSPSTIEKVIVRPLLSLRRARFNYSENLSTTVPGFMPQSQILGMNNFESPGWDFVVGLQPKIRTITDDQRFNPNPDNLEGDWLRENAEWITPSVFHNREVIQQYTQSYDARVTVEPFRDFRVDLDLTKSFTENYSETFKDTSIVDGVTQLVHTVPLSTGQMQISYFAMNTLFRDSEDEILELFRRFENNRVIISNRLGDGDHEDSNLADLGYTDGFGRTQQDVILPAFIAAYTEEDPGSVDLNVFDAMPKVNWNLQYNGLSRVPLFKNLFQNFSLKHGYRSSLAVNNYRSSLPYLATLGTTGGLDTSSFNFFPRLEIADVVIQEDFAPLIGIDMTLVNGMSLRTEYKKSRMLALSTVNYQLNETRSEEFFIEFGYLLRNVDIPFLTGSKKKKKRKGEEEQQPQNQGRGNRRGGGGRGLQTRDLDISFSFSLRDDITYAHRLDEGITDPTRGNYTISLSPAAEYQLNQRLSLRLFFDYRSTNPVISTSPPQINTSGGIVVSFQLN